MFGRSSSGGRAKRCTARDYDAAALVLVAIGMALAAGYFVHWPAR